MEAAGSRGRSISLREALEIQNRHSALSSSCDLLLACGFTPLHLGTFLAAHCQLRNPGSRVALRAGLYGDLAGTLAAVPARPPVAALVMIEWADLDARLGVRQLGGWAPELLDEIGQNVRLRLKLAGQLIQEAAAHCRVVVAPPALPPAPVYFAPAWQRPAVAAEMEAGLASVLAELASAGIVVLEAGRYPAGERLDMKSLLTSGFPYQKLFAERLAAHCAEALLPSAPKKGLITDLDGTLWRGILGDDGAEGIGWDLEHQGQIHGIYQTLLESLAGAGVLLGVASKNDSSNVEEALRRTDLLVKPRNLFPVEANWGPKSESVARILRAWNIGADAVVFVDDSPMELAEVERAHPGVLALRFPSGDPQAAWEMFHQLRDLFGKAALSAEDGLRLESLRSAAGRESQFEKGDRNLSEDLLASADAVIEIESPISRDDRRSLELLNKTNQFNLNGRRYTEAEWRVALADANSFSLAVNYRDRFGPLGKIAVALGQWQGPELHLLSWVMSCRAFSRRIEYQILRYLFETKPVDRLILHFTETSKNGPARDFLDTIGAGDFQAIDRESFLAACPRLYHDIHEISHDRH